MDKENFFEDISFGEALKKSLEEAIEYVEDEDEPVEGGGILE